MGWYGINDKCRFAGRCKSYDKDQPACSKNGGDYYGVGKPGGCYRKFEEEERRGKIVARKYKVLKGKEDYGYTIVSDKDPKEIKKGLQKGFSLKEIGVIRKKKISSLSKIIGDAAIITGLIIAAIISLPFFLLLLIVAWLSGHSDEWAYDIKDL